MKKTFILITVIVAMVCFGIYKYFHSTEYFYTKITPKGSTLTISIIERDIKLFKKIDNLFVASNPIAVKSKSSDINTKFLTVGGIKNKNVLTGYERPFEVKFVIRVMLYLKERQLSPEINNIVSVVGSVEVYKLENVISFINSPDIRFEMKMSEFDEIYNETDLAKLSIDKQINVLTQKWILKTGYSRNY